MGLGSLVGPRRPNAASTSRRRMRERPVQISLLADVERAMGGIFGKSFRLFADLLFIIVGKRPRVYLGSRINLVDLGWRGKY